MKKIQDNILLFDVKNKKVAFKQDFFSEIEYNIIKRLELNKFNKHFYFKFDKSSYDDKISSQLNNIFDNFASTKISDENLETIFENISLSVLNNNIVEKDDNVFNPVGFKKYLALILKRNKSHTNVIMNNNLYDFQNRKYSNTIIELEKNFMFNEEKSYWNYVIKYSISEKVSLYFSIYYKYNESRKINIYHLNILKKSQTKSKSLDSEIFEDFNDLILFFNRTLEKKLSKILRRKIQYFLSIDIPEENISMTPYKDLIKLAIY